MHGYAQKPTATQQSAIPGQAPFGKSRDVNSILHLQRTVGHQAVQPLRQAQPDSLEPISDATASARFGHDFSRISLHAKTSGKIQSKLSVNTPGDRYEQEADRVAAQVMRMPEPRRQRTWAGGAECAASQAGKRAQATARLQTQHVGSGELGQTAAPPSVHEVLGSPGQPLDSEVRDFMEPRFGHDFSRVRVHCGRAEERSAQDIGAHAYTLEHDIVFGAGQFTPGTPDGRRLIAHELAHVMQQTGGEDRAAPRLSSAGTSVIQRDAAIGLRKADEFSDFAKFARDFASANPDRSLEELGLFLMDKANAQLIGNGELAILDPPSFGAVRNGAAGGFSHQTWRVALDLAKTAAHPLTAKIRDLTADQIAEVAGICYHEARHAEQSFLVARVVANEAKGKKDAKALAAELAIPEFVAKAALNSTEPLPGKAAMAQIQQWRAFGKSGKHRDYWDWNETFRAFVENVIANFPMPRPAGVDSVIAAWTVLTPTFADWRKSSVPSLQVKIDTLTKTRTRDATDQQVLVDAKKIRAGIQKVIDADKALSDEVAKFRARQAAADKQPIQLDEARKIQSEFAFLWIHLELVVRELGQTTNDAYRAYPIEADAYAAEDSVMKTFLSKPKAAALKK